MRVLCVDDERILMEDTVNLCRDLDLIDEAVGFTRPADALEYLEREWADLALLDIDMPGMNGIELAAAIREKQPEIPIIFLTGYFRVSLVLDDVTLWESELLAPGETSAPVALREPLPAGEYEVQLCYACFSDETEQNALNGARSPVRLIVG